MAKMTVTQKEATDLFVKVGMVIASKWDAAKLQAKLASLDKMEGVAEKVAKIEDESLRKLGEKTLKACAAKVNIHVVADGPAEKPDAEAEEEPMEVKKPKGDKPTKPAAKPVKPAAKVPAKKPEASKKEKKEPAEKDAWGTRKGTRTARINAVLLAGKPVSVKEIEEKAQAHGIHSHLSKLMADGKIVKTEDGKKYQLKGPKPEKKVKSK